MHYPQKKLTRRDIRATNTNTHMDTQKALELIEKSEHLALLLPPDPGIDCAAGAEVLTAALEDKGKAVGFVAVAREHPVSLPAVFKKVLNPPGLIREFVVSLDTASSPVSQLRYEKHEDRIDVILSPKSGPVRKESFSFRDGNIQCDCIVALGIPDIEAIRNAPDMRPRLPSDAPIINIDIASENRRYGEANLVSGDKTSIAEIVWELLRAGNSWLPAGESATLLLAGIVAAADSFASSFVSASAMNAAGQLIGAGASYAKARDLARHAHTLPLLQLASRAAVRSKEDLGSGIAWSFLTAEDFEKTSRTGADLNFVLRHLSSLMPPQKARVLLWQDSGGKNIRAMLRADAPVLETVLAREPGSFQSPHLALDAQFSSFQEAEERIASLLKDLL